MRTITRRSGSSSVPVLFHRSRGCWPALYAVIFGLLGGSVADAGEVYGFQHIADTTVRSAPAINNNGAVAFVKEKADSRPALSKRSMAA